MDDFSHGNRVLTDLAPVPDCGRSTSTRQSHRRRRRRTATGVAQLRDQKMVAPPPVRVRLTVLAQDWTMHESASVEITARNSLRSQSAEVGQTEVSSGRPELLAVSMTAELRAAVPGTRRKPF